MSRPDLRIAIIGAGIIGVTLAHALLERDIPVKIYEASKEIRTIGGGINATEAGVRALKLCGKHCYDAFKEVSTTHNRKRPEIFWNVTKNGNDVLAEVISEKEYGSMNRIKFLEALAARLPVEIVQFNHRIKSMHDTGEQVVLEFDDGSTEIADLVLGCDGLHSQTRQFVVGPGHEPSFSQNIICRGPIPMKGVAAIVGEEVGIGSQVGIGNADGVVLYPVDDTTVNFGYYHWEEENWPHWPRVAPMWTKAELLSKIHSKQNQPDPKHLALVHLLPDEITQWAIFHQERDLPTYSKGAIAVLGDAAHASSPYLSTGAGMGYEDAVVCAELLKAVILIHLGAVIPRSAIEAALNVYSDTRRGRSQYMVHSSLEAGKTLMGFRPTAAQGAQEYAERNYEVWNYDIQEGIDLALGRFLEIVHDSGVI